MLLTPAENDGLIQIRSLITVYLESGKGTSLVREFLTKSSQDDTLLLRFLRGRRFNPNHAWETLKKHAEIRFDIYPEMFIDNPCEKIQNLLTKSEIFGVLKSRDSLGRRIILFQTSQWDPDEYSADDVTLGFVNLVEELLLDKDCIENGIVYVQDCHGANKKHAQQFSIGWIRKMIDIFWHSYPVTVKGVNFVNTPSFLNYVLKMARLVFPKRLKEIFFVTSHDASDRDGIQHLLTSSPDELPECLGGTLKFNEAVQFFNYSEIKQSNRE